MAETFNKKERNKKKLQKRKDKEQRREERRMDTSKTGKSLDDMIAYVDEYGNFSDTPPDKRKTSTIKAEDIPIDIPREEPEDPDALPTGTISYFDAAKGYGFITGSKKQERIFVHQSQLADPSITLSTGDTVEYQAKKGPRGLQAEFVRKI